MAQLNPNDVNLVSLALRENRLVFLSGPRRCGLSTWCVQHVGPDLAHRSRVARIDLSQPHTVSSMEAELAALVGQRVDLVAGTLPVDGPQRDCLWVFHSAHRADRAVVVGLIRLLGAADVRGPAVLFEGALDAESVYREAFPAGALNNPLFLYVAASAPWRSLSEIEDLRRDRYPAHDELLACWVADFAGSDIRLAVELFENLPAGQYVDEDSITHAVDRVVRHGAVRADIARLLDGGFDEPTLRTILSGRCVFRPPPRILPDAGLRALYLGGIVDFDGVSSAYRLRSPLVGAIAGDLTHFTPWHGTLVGPQELSSRTAVLMSHIGSAELQLRSALAHHKVKELATDVRLLSESANVVTNLKATLMRDPLFPDPCREAILKIIAEKFPNKVSVLDTVTKRGWAEPADLLPFTTIAELAGVASMAGLLDGPLLDDVGRLGDHRNDVAHFRGVGLSDGRDILSRTRTVLRALARAPLGSSAVANEQPLRVVEPSS